MTSTASSTFTAFFGHSRVASGSRQTLERALQGLEQSGGGLLVFDDGTGAQVDFPWMPDQGAEPPHVEASPEPSLPAGVGRPRLGVVAREVTLLPRHWEWLATQRGGASATLRRLVEEARRGQAEQDVQRLAKERAYRFMSAMGGGLPGFEEASRALFAHDAADFGRRLAHWPQDIQSHLAWLARDAFPASQGPSGEPL